MLKVALAGCGDFSQYHLQAWRRQKDAQVAALYNRTLPKAEARAKEFDIPLVFDDLERMLDEVRPDILDIALAPGAHISAGIAAARRGIHVLCQKPFAYSVSEAQKLIDACNQNQVKLMINEDHRFMEWVMEARRLVQEGAVGRPFYIRLLERVDALFPHKGNRRDIWQNLPFYLKEETGVLHEWGIHHMESIRHIMGKDVKSVYAVLKNVIPEEESIPADTFDSIILNFEDGTHGVYEVSYANYDTETSLRIDGDEGSLTSPDLLRMYLFRGDTCEKTLAADIPPYESNNARRVLCQTRIQEHFINCILNDQKPILTGEDNLNSLATMLACYRSSRENRVVDVEEMSD